MTQSTFLSVETESQLNDYCQHLINCPEITWIAVDTEFVREDTYFPNLSLIQIQDCLGQLAIIDPLKIQESSTQVHPKNALAPFIDLLCDANTLKVFHCARQDIEVLYQLAHKMPVAIFDTQIATLFLKLGEMAGFARVVKETLGIAIDKSQTRTNWHARPLTEAQIEYALDDVRYLAPLYEHCLKALSSEELNAVNEECDALLNESLYVIDPKTAGAKLKGIKGFKPKKLAIAYALAEWRETFAITHNQPKKWVMNDEVITQMTKRPPKTVEALYKVPHIKSSSIMSYGEEWIALIDAVFEQPPDQWPQPPKKVPSPTAQEDAIIQLLNGYAQQVAIEYRLNLPSLLQRNDIHAIIKGASPEKPLFSGWRNLLIGQPLLAILQGQGTLSIKNRQIIFTQEQNQ
ncbi:MAG: ribonuclease D [Thiomicrorhabdus sp.]|nr:ribonuclease D [Thiomicrorhabdus sp.]